MLIINNNDISFNPKMRIFIVKGTKEVPRMATLFPKQSCTCPSTGECYHVLAIKISLGMATGREGVNNLTKLRINGRNKKGKKMWQKKAKAK